MKRKQFIKNAALTAAGSMVVPYILPSGRLFAATGSRRANHVVFCLFAGGVRNLESVYKAEGNLMRNTLSGTESISPDIAPGITQLPLIASSPLQTQGTLYKEFRYANGPTGHYNGHTTAITGRYSDESIQLKQPPKYPTIFEYYRKHTSPTTSALNAWWISNQLGPYPYLNYSMYDGYGPAYGANMIQPASIFNGSSISVLGDPLTISQAERNKCDMMRDFMNGQFKVPQQAASSGIVNTPQDAERLQVFLQNQIAQLSNIGDPWGTGAMTGDMINVYFGIEVLKEFKPELMVINMTDIDIAHFDYTKYANAIGVADYALYKLWQAINSIPEMAGDTVLIAVPEHGRNQISNSVIDTYGRYALDHTSDEMSRKIFCLMAGKGVKTGQVLTVDGQGNGIGQSVDVVPTIANILGIDNEIPFGMMEGRVLNEAFS
ncbi:MAG TPA: hypothetical protein VK154_19705 [Chitinophagales bacterium]|nr:hypothetical protein [Chitinophagales bacterium]